MTQSSCRSLTDPEFDVNDLRATIARRLHAERSGGYDGNEHPEELRAVDAMLSACYPVTPDIIVGIITRKYRLVQG